MDQKKELQEEREKSDRRYHCMKDDDEQNHEQNVALYERDSYFTSFWSPSCVHLHEALLNVSSSELFSAVRDISELLAASSTCDVS